VSHRRPQDGEVAASDGTQRDTVAFVGPGSAAGHTEVRNWKVNSEEGLNMLLRNTGTNYLLASSTEQSSS
jgi:hypothetical protein